MKNWLSSLLGSRGINDLSGRNLPWLDGKSIYDHIAHNIDPQTGKLTPKGQDLPDEERRYSGTQLRWIPGAMDGVFSHRVTSEETDRLAKQVSKYVLEIATNNSNKAKVALYRILLKDEILSFIDNALENIVTIVHQPTSDLHSFTVFLAKTAPDRGPVKFAIALLGIIRDFRDVDLVMHLGLHEEFTLYAAVAISNILADPENQLWSLAKRVDGWGKIHLVERLATTSSEEIKDWLLRDGYRNSVMNEYLAYACAVGGGLRDALYKPEVDDELLLSAGEIIDALITGGPAQDIQDYADAADVILRYLELLFERASKIGQYLVLGLILGYLTDQWDMNAGWVNGWTPEKRDRAIVLVNQILQNPGWLEIVERGLHSSYEPEFFLATRAAELLGIETWELYWTRINEKPLDSRRWLAVMKKADQQRIDQVIDLAVKVLPLEQVASGPSKELGLGPQFQIHQCLDFIVQDLKRFPGKGLTLVLVCLKSPVVRNRNMALNAIEAWGKDYRTQEVQEALVEAVSLEPDEKVKARLANLIQAK